MPEPRTVAAALLLTIFAPLLAMLCGCAGYIDSVSARQIGYDGKTISYRIEYSR